jgi:mannose-6-phosphate isomerase
MPARCDSPLRFQPLFRRYLWGGRRLATRLGKSIGPEHDYAESWEVVDHDDDQSVVIAGPLAGATLGELVQERGPELLGRHAPRTRFPLLMKLLDCNRTLSVQVHPNDQQAARQSPPDLGKTEAWVVIDAEPGSRIYAGLKPGVTPDQLRAALDAGTCAECLHDFAARPGDCVFIPAGTVHALGEGLLIAEIQQASDTTFRLFDWNRVDAQGQPRPLHIEQALAVTDFERGPIKPQTPAPTPDANRERLVACDQFQLDRRRASEPVVLGGDDRFCLLTVLDGALTLDGDPTRQPLHAGESALLPAAAGPTRGVPTGETLWLESALP